MNSILDCKINDRWTYNEMRVVRMENEFFNIGVLVGRGGDIFEFRFKPCGLNLLLRLQKDIHNPMRMFSQMRNTANQFEDYYYGGWQEILPNSAPMNYRGAQLGQHGEVSLIPWEHSIIKADSKEVILKLWTRPLRIPICIEKYLTLRSGSAQLQIDERLVNESGTDLQLMWGHHLAFGLPLLEDGALLDTSARKFRAEPDLEGQHLFQTQVEQNWPHVMTEDGNLTNASVLHGPDVRGSRDLVYLSDFESEAFYSIETDKLLFRLEWDKNVFKHLWYWQERYATSDAPWWGNTFAVGLEPWTSPWHPSPTQRFMDDHWLTLKSNSHIETSLKVKCMEKT